MGRKRVARLMRAAGLRGVSRRRFAVTTQSDQRVRPAPDRVERSFTADAPDQLYVGDITYIPTWEGFLYLATVLDVFSRRVVGWAMADHLRTELVLDALDMALEQRRPEAVHPSQRPGLSVHLGGLYRALPGGRRRGLHGLGGRLL